MNSEISDDDNDYLAPDMNVSKFKPIRSGNYFLLILFNQNREQKRVKIKNP